MMKNETKRTAGGFLRDPDRRCREKTAGSRSFLLPGRCGTIRIKKGRGKEDIREKAVPSGGTAVQMISIMLPFLVISGSHADLGEERPMERAGVVISAGVGHFLDGIGRVLQKRAGIFNAHAVDEFPEIHVQALGEDMAQMASADAHGHGDAVESQWLLNMIGYIQEHPVNQVAVHIGFKRIELQMRKQQSQKQMDIGGDLRGIVSRNISERPDDLLQLRVVFMDMIEGIEGQRGFKAGPEFIDQVRIHADAHGAVFLRRPFITVDHHGKNDEDISGPKEIGDAVGRDLLRSGFHIHDFDTFVDMGRIHNRACRSDEQIAVFMFKNQGSSPHDFLYGFILCRKIISHNVMN